MLKGWWATALTECTKHTLRSLGVEGREEQRSARTVVLQAATLGPGHKLSHCSYKKWKAKYFQVNSPTSEVCSEAAPQAGTQVCWLLLKYHYKVPKPRLLSPTVFPVFQHSEYLSEFPFTILPWMGQSWEQLIPIKGDNRGEGGCAWGDRRPYQSFWGKGLVWKSFKE